MVLQRQILVVILTLVMIIIGSVDFFVIAIVIFTVIYIISKSNISYDNMSICKIHSIDKDLDINEFKTMFL